MRCHYEVLNISKEADDAEIKSSYKKLALRWHPDKNLEDVENAKEQFQLVQQAYEVLSDRQERAWYDRHREQILHGANSDFADKNLDVFQYFTTACFKGYGDDENGFYTVYRKVFDQIAKEDMDYFENKEDFVNIPSFGSSDSDYDTVVNPFYAHWMSYSTKKSYVWLDPYSINDVRDRRYLKAVEKENKKVRAKAKKERNEEIRNLVAFVRKRDKRVQAWNKLNAAKIETNRKKLEDLRRQKLLENRKMNESQVQAEWTKFENMSSQLHEIEKNLNQEFGNSDISDDEYNDLYCPACNKLFRTVKSFQNHESSKRHKENVAVLRAQLLAEDGDENSSETDKNCLENNLEEIDSELSSGKRLTNQSEEDSDVYEEEIDLEIPRRKKTQKTKYSASQHYMSPDTDSEDVPTSNLHKRPNKVKKNKNVLKIESTDDELKMSTLPASSSSEDFSSSKKGKKKNKKNKAKKAQPAENVDVAPVLEDEKSLAKENISKDIPSKEKASKFVCSTCSKNYPSKNKLFRHLQAEDHGAPLLSNQTGAISKGKNKNKGSKK
ncbi:dnaJ homolog subfamily C member 21 [Coccinella septempunctata]|uniref:dnaJ homolog subfamily C member 21 n=1 Tax=Coccinella septempunctata TaxID=41139 RepID=UPI001D06E950|nr:dnaJ homolog subfamily C member 21 [Coccinella septempunctata]